jgi:hypothetical protein
MTRDQSVQYIEQQIKEWAREAGWRVDSEGEVLEGDGWHIQTDIVERFAELVAAAEREACAKLCFQMWNKWMDSEYKSEFTRPDAEDCAEAIRARGQV